MKHIHPDYVAGEPVPVVEPYVNEELLAQSLKWLRVSRWAIALFLVLIVFFAIFHVSLMARYITLGVLYAGFMWWGFRPSRRAIRKKRWSQAKADKWALPMRITIQFQMHVIILMVLVYVFVSPSGGFSVSSSYVGMFLLVGGFVSIYFGREGREPGQICCEKCSYELAGLTLPCQCPECGIWLLSLDMITDRPRVQSPWFFRIGVSMIPMGLAVLVIGVVQPSAFYGPVPKSMLISLAATDAGAFEQLMSRPLSQLEEDQLENGIINAYATGRSRMNYEQEHWLEDQGKAGSLDASQLNQLYESFPPLWIDADERVSVGDEVVIRLGAKRVKSFYSELYPKVCFGGFVIDDDQTRHQSINHAMSYISIVYQDKSIDMIHTPGYVFVPEAVGEVVIRARVVLMYDVRIALGSAVLDWSDDGEPIFKSPPLWYRVIDLEHTIIVEP